jgi:hypothetical protein
MKKILIIGCIHGNERFGYDLIKYIKSEPDLRSEVDTVIGSPKALHLNRRCIDQDLNRSFGKDVSGYEEQRSSYLKKLMSRYDYVLDIHNTNTSVLNATIVTVLGDKSRLLIGNHPSNKVIVMEEPFAGMSLIGYKGDGAVSFEYNREYAREHGIAEMVATIKGLLCETNILKRVEVFHVKSTVPLKTQLGTNDYNYVLLPDESGYGILVGENAYKLHKGFVAYKKEVIHL